MPQIRSKEIIDLVKRAAESLSQLDDENLSVRPSEDKWSSHEILGHLIDSAYNNHRRFVLAAVQEDLVFDGYPQDHWVELHAYNQREWQSLIDTWLNANLHLAAMINNLPEQSMRRPTTEHNFHEIGFRKIGKGEAATLDFLIEDYIIHIEHHLKQLL